MFQIEKITSRDNRRLVRVRKIRDGENSVEIFIEGRRLVREAIKSEIAPVECFVSEGFHDLELTESIRELVPVFELPATIFASIADTEQPQGIILIAKRPSPVVKLTDYVIEENRSRLPHFAFLKEANNPSNLGAIFRTAEAAGVEGVIISPRSADAFSSKAIRAAMGSCFRLKIWERVEFANAVNWARLSGLRVVATEPVHGLSHYAYDWTKPTLIVFGSEAHGLSNEDLNAVDQNITIELAPDVESLNLAVAAGIILFEARRQVSNG